jgi:thioesterase domain-containing protein
VEVRESVAKNIEKYLEDLGVGFLKEKILGRVKKYRRYFTNQERLEVVNAYVHLILSEENRDTHKARCWDQFTAKTSRIYQGFGSHDEMLDAGHVEKNAEIIREILDKIKAN